MTKIKPAASGEASETGERGRIALPLKREHMPTDYSISLAAYTGRGTDDDDRGNCGNQDQDWSVNRPAYFG